ncbi:MAG: hypothetical protein VCF07_10710 [Nitrospinota bacterium]
MRRTSVSVLPHNGIAGAAYAAFQKSTEHELAAVNTIQSIARLISRHLDASVFLSLFYLVPQVVIDDPKVWNLDAFPLFRWVGANNTFSGSGVFYIGAAIPNKPADIEFIIEKPRSSRGLTADSGVTPLAATRTGDVLVVEFPCDMTRTDAIGVFFKYASNSACFVFDDLAVAGFSFGNPVSIGKAAT